MGLGSSQATRVANLVESSCVNACVCVCACCLIKCIPMDFVYSGNGSTMGRCELPEEAGVPWTWHIINVKSQHERSVPMKIISFSPCHPEWPLYVISSCWWYLLLQVRQAVAPLLEIGWPRGSIYGTIRGLVKPTFYQSKKPSYTNFLTILKKT